MSIELDPSSLQFSYDYSLENEVYTRSVRRAGSLRKGARYDPNYSMLSEENIDIFQEEEEKQLPLPFN